MEAQLAMGPQGLLSSANTRPSPDLLGWKLLTLGCWDQILCSDLSGSRGASTQLRGLKIQVALQAVLPHSGFGKGELHF